MLVSVSRRVKRLTAGAFGALALAASAFLTAPYFLSEQDVRLAAMRALRAATGVEPTVAGPISVSLLPTATVRLEDVKIENGGHPAFTAGALRASVRLVPLLYGRIEISSLTFEHANVTATISEDGALAISLPMTAGALPQNVESPEIRFVDGTVLMRAHDSDRLEALQHVNLALARSGAGLTATGAFQWRAMPATISLSVNNLAEIANGKRSAVRLRLESSPLTVSFDGGVAYRNGLQAEGSLSAEARALRTFLAHFPNPPRLTRDGFGPFRFKARAALTGSSLALTGVSVELDGNRADGGITVQYERSRTTVQATLASESADFTAYSGGFAMVDESGRDWSREPIDLSGFGLFDLDMRLSAGQVTVRKTQLAQVAATATMRNGRLTLAVGDARFHRGTLRGRAVFGQGANGIPEFKIDATVSDFDLGPGFAALADIQRLEGKGTLALAVESSGHDMFALTRGLSGTMTLSAAQGTLSGINVEQALRRLERNPLSGSPELAGGRTTFDRLNAKLRIEEGTATIEEAQVTSTQMRLRLAGEASVVRRHLDLRGTATLVQASASAAAPSFELPFLLLGSWERPFLLPDPTALIQRSGSTAPVIDAARRQSESKTASEPAAAN
jgi:AsmA protein